MRGEDKGGCKMVNSCNTSWRGEGGEGFRTVECLRGRLLAERVASRVAKEDSENLAKRLTELERMMATEIKARNKAEKRLKNALTKLESLNLIEFPGLSEISKDILVENQLDSSSGSTPCLEMAERKKSCSQSQNSTAKDKERNKSSERTLDNTCFSADSTNQSATQETSWSSAGSADSVNKCGNVQEKDGESRNFFRYNGVLAGDSTRRPPHDYHVQRDEHVGGNPETVPASFWSETSKVPIKSNAHEKIEPDVESKRSFTESLTSDKISKGVSLTVGELKSYFEHLVTVKEPLQTTGLRNQTN